MKKNNDICDLHPLKPLTIVISIACALLPFSAQADVETVSKNKNGIEPSSGQLVEFDPAFLSAFPGSQSNLAQYKRGNPLKEGTYPSIISVNDNNIGRKNVRIASIKGEPTVCMSPELLTTAGVIREKMDPLALKALDEAGSCIPFSALSSIGSARYDMSELTLNFALPQAIRYQLERGYVSPELWDGGKTSLLFNYNSNYYNMVSHGKSTQSVYAGLNAGFNFDSWMFRHAGNYNWQDDSGSTYKSNRTYLQRDINALRSRITIGQNFTDGQLFDTFGFRGVQLATVDQMLPDSMRDFAPIIQGTANTNARVTVKQNGVILYETVVPPGPFTINDLYPTGYGGDIDVTIREADGRIQSFSVPFSSVAQLLRAGITRYSVLAGEVDIQDLHWHPKIVHGSLQHGFNNIFTGYTGGLVTDDYSAALLGAAVNTGLGAFALDITGARTNLEDFSRTGTSTRLTFNKRIAETRSNISLAAYRYSSSGYLDLNSAMSLASWEHRSHDEINRYYSWRQKSRFSMTLNQYLDDPYGQFYLTGYSQNYWGRSGTDTQFQFGYSNFWRSLSYGLSFSRQRNSIGQNENQIALTLSVPLGTVDAHTPYLSMNSTYDSHNKLSSQTSVSGQLGEYNQADYSVGYTHSRDDDAGNMSASYRTPWSQATGSYAQGNNYHSSSAGLSGSMLLHGGGLTMSPYTANTLALVHAPDAAGAQILSYPDIHLNDSGYALVPNLRPYKLNDIILDPKGLSTDVELLSTKEQTVPREGAVVAVNFMTDSGRSVLITSLDARGQPLPFGASITDQNHNLVGYVGQGGMALIRLKEDKARLNVNINDRPLCSLDVDLPPAKSNKAQRFERIDTRCLSE